MAATDGDSSTANIIVPKASSGALWSCDSKLVDQRLAEDAARLFAKDVDEVEVWRTLGSETDGHALNRGQELTIKLFTIRGPDMLRQFWQASSRHAPFIPAGLSLTSPIRLQQSKTLSSRYPDRS